MLLNKGFLWFDVNKQIENTKECIKGTFYLCEKHFNNFEKYRKCVITFFSCWKVLYIYLFIIFTTYNNNILQYLNNKV